MCTSSSNVASSICFTICWDDATSPGITEHKNEKEEKKQHKTKYPILPSPPFAQKSIPSSTSNVAVLRRRRVLTTLTHTHSDTMRTSSSPFRTHRAWDRCRPCGVKLMNRKWSDYATSINFIWVSALQCKSTLIFPPKPPWHHALPPLDGVPLCSRPSLPQRGALLCHNPFAHPTASPPT